MLAALASACGPVDSPPPPRPNILVLLADDLRADAAGFAGNGYVDTPSLDALAGAGFYFRKAHIMGGHHAAVCAPSRAMLLSGRTLFRVYDDLDAVDTLPQRLGRLGYVTFGTGKWHQSRESFEKSFRYGRNIMFGGMSDHFQVPLSQLTPERTFTEPVRAAYSTQLFADAAIAFLNRHAASPEKAPFFAYVAFTAPHDPRTPPEPYAHYSADSMPLPPNFLPAHPFNLGPRTMAVRDEMLAPWPRSPKVIREQTADYFGLIAHLDAEIGRILGELRRLDLSRDTVVVFASDNGLALGSHGLLGKQSLYEHSTRVPLVIAGPGIPPGRSDALVYLHDVYATVGRLAGLRRDAAIESRDLSRVWRDEADAARRTLFGAYADAQRSVQDGKWKLISYPRIQYRQLFDLERDPHELRNLADDDAHQGQVQRMLALLRESQREHADPLLLRAASPDGFEFDYRGIERTIDRHQPEIIRRKYYAELQGRGGR